MGEIQKGKVVHQAKMLLEAHQNEHKFLIDAAPESGGEGKGVRPKALILTSLAGCTAMDVLSLLQKMRVEFSDFSVEAEGELTEEHPKIYHKVWLKYFIRLSNEADKEKMEKAVSLSQEKYCGVSAMVKKFADLSLEIVYL
ncbi:MAG: OsmC family protein [Chitinophagales bacterium]|nr:OsmC family protein [Chitinophagales bacterium]MDW8272760.1 OsmC family protein [Chitinophagales bacterium]